jgi:hypothetical protein
MKKIMAPVLAVSMLLVFVVSTAAFQKKATQTPTPAQGAVFTLSGAFAPASFGACIDQAHSAAHSFYAGSVYGGMDEFTCWAASVVLFCMHANNCQERGSPLPAGCTDTMSALSIDEIEAVKTAIARFEDKQSLTFRERRAFNRVVEKVKRLPGVAEAFERHKLEQGRIRQK